MSSDDLNPWSASSPDEFATLLRRAQVRAGGPSLRTLERWAEKQQTAGRQLPSLPHATIQEVLAGHRLPTSAVLVALLEALGVVGDAQKPWVDVRNRLEEQRRGRNVKTARVPQSGSAKSMSPAGDHDPETELHALALATSPLARKPVLLGTGAVALAVLLTLVISVLLTSQRDNDDAPTAGDRSLPGSNRSTSAQLPRPPQSSFTTILQCAPDNCAGSARLALTGQASGDLPVGYEPYLLNRVESTGRWYLGPAVVPNPTGSWTSEIGIGNPVPQPKNRQFTICVYLLPTATIDRLSQRLASYMGDGLPVEELPPDRTKLACVAAVRLANS